MSSFTLIEVIPGDTHTFLLTFLISVFIQYFFFFVAYVCQFDLLTDLVGSINFIVNAIVPFSLVRRDFSGRPAMIMACIVASRLLLGGFLFYRVISRKSDGRFDEVRTKFWSFFAFWTFQLIWCWGVSLNAIFALTDEQNPPLGPSDYVGVVLFAVALVLQTGADLQKNAFRQNPENKGIPCTKWFWAVSRHPNYFGEMLQWWMIFLLSAPVLWKSADQWGWVTVISPVLTMLILLFLSGMPTAEGKALERFYKSEKGRPIIEDYMESVPPIIPFVPVLYRLFPRWLKMLICFEFPMYQYSPSSDEEGDPEGGAGTGGRMHGVSGAPGQQQLMSPGSDDKRSS